MKILLVLIITAMTISCSDPSNKQAIDKSLGALCGQDLQIGKMAINMRDKGSKRDFLQLAVDAIPQNESRKKRIMNSALEDAFNNPELPLETYAMYRMEVCYFQMSGKNIPEFLSPKMVEFLIRCDKMISQDKKYACASAVASAYSK